MGLAKHPKRPAWYSPVFSALGLLEEEDDDDLSTVLAG
eukprot:CAMPEP_0168316506 /NCGR_PEP_ID=MMETSP0210-20121227/16021_1 /TAXON_ID=40633 /ORGANISM="Condylostoma magnum, Strain COL2" /LENGTH=37 /DNA_ID= /DNA_START= /DNA_END= /DNA_ORIENTATION=